MHDNKSFSKFVLISFFIDFFFQLTQNRHSISNSCSSLAVASSHLLSVQNCNSDEQMRKSTKIKINMGLHLNLGGIDKDVYH